MTHITTLQQLYDIDESLYDSIENITIIDESMSSDDLIKISKFKNVILLQLFKNNIFELPECICDLTELKILKISINYLTKLPISIDKLINLLHLDLSWNAISVLQPEIFNLQNLCIFEITNNCLTTIPLDIAKLNEQLRVLYIGNKLYNNEIKIGRDDGDITTINIIDYAVNKNKIETLPSEFAELYRLYLIIMMVLYLIIMMVLLYQIIL